MSKIIEEHINIILKTLNKIKEHDDLINILNTYYENILNKKQNKYYVIQMLNNVENIHNLFDISDLTKNEYWTLYIHDTLKLYIIIKHLFESKMIMDTNGNRILTPKMKSKKLVADYYMKQCIRYGKQMKINHIMPIMYNMSKDTL